MKKAVSLFAALLMFLGVFQLGTAAANRPALRAENVTSEAFTLKWDKVKKAAAYNIYEYVFGNYEFMEQTKGTSFTTKGRTPGSAYYFYVEAVDKNSKYIKNSTTDILTVVTPPKDPKLKKVSFKGDMVTVQWSKAAGTKDYAISLYNEKTKEWEPFTAVRGTSLTFKYTAGKKHTLLIRAFCVVDGITVSGKTGLRVKFTAPKKLPSTKKQAADMYNSAVNNLKSSKASFTMTETLQTTHTLKSFSGTKTAKDVFLIYDNGFNALAKKTTYKMTAKNGKLYYKGSEYGRITDHVEPLSKKAVLSPDSIEQFKASVLSNGNIRLNLTLRGENSTFTSKKANYAWGLSQVYEPFDVRALQADGITTLNSATLSYNRPAIQAVIRPDGKLVSAAFNIPYTLTMKYTTTGEGIETLLGKKSKDVKSTAVVSGNSLLSYSIAW